MFEENTIIGSGWLNYKAIRPVAYGTYLVAKRVGSRWAIALAYYDKANNCFEKEEYMLSTKINDVEYWHFMPDLPELE